MKPMLLIAGAALLLAAAAAGDAPADEGGGSSATEPLVHCLRALALLRVPLPWSPEYERSPGRLTEAKIAWDRLLALGWRRRIHPSAAAVAQRDVLQRAVHDLHVLSTLESVLAAPGDDAGGDGGTHAKEEAREGPLVMQTLSAALLAQPAPDAPSLRYALWACRALEGGRVRRGSALYATWAQLDEALRRCRAAPGAALLRPLQQVVGVVRGGSRTGSGRRVS